MTQRGARFAAGILVSPGEYRNTETGAVRYFDGNTPLPGGVNAPSWEQVSDHFHAREERVGGGRVQADRDTRPVRFASGALVSPGQYRNVDTGAVRFFDGQTPLPGGVNSPSWEQISDHHHPSAASDVAGERRIQADRDTRPVRFAAGTLVSPGQYRNVDTGTVRFFDGTTPLPGGVNAASWEQISDHHHPDPARIGSG